MRVVAPSLFVGVSALQYKDSPVTRVVELVKGLKSEIVEDGKKEQETYDKFACYCEDTLAAKAAAIEKAQDEIAELSKDIVELKGITATLKVDIKQLEKDIAANLKSQEEATALRQTEHDEYHTTREDTEAATKALKSATDVLAKATGRGLIQEVQTLSVVSGVKRALAMLPKESLGVSDMESIQDFIKDPSTVLGKKNTAFMQETHNPHGDYAPASTAIQGILKNMYDTFTSNMQNSNEEEATKQKEFEELIETKQAELKALRHTLTDKKTMLGDKNKEMADKKTQREETQVQLKADQEFWADTKESCQLKADEWAERTRLRTEELAGIEEAIKILSEGADTFAESADTMFLQFSAKDIKKAKALDKIKSMAKSQHSLRLAALAATVTTTGHFDKVIEEIDGMIRVLRKEEDDDVEHKKRCEAQETLLGSQKDTFDRNKGDAEAEKERLQQKAKATETEKANKESELKETLASLEAALALRNKQNDEYKKARKADAEAVQLITAAIGSLMKFYENNKIALVSQTKKASKFLEGIHNKPAPETWSKPYGGRKSENTGVVAILEMIKEDIQNEMKQATKDEAESVAEYMKGRKALEATQQACEQAIVTANKMLADIDYAIDALNDAINTLDGKLDANAEGSKAQSTDCAWVKNNFESRRTKRQNELEGLQQAKSFLAGAIEENTIETAGVF